MTSTRGTTSDEGGGPRLEATPAEAARRADGIEITLRLRNPDASRAVHYVSEVRAITVAPDGGFVVRLTDEGRELIPGALQRDPEFGRVDPGATAMLAVRIPDTIVRMRVGATPTSEVELETFTAPPSQEVEVVIGWSDTPFYPDPRDKGQRAQSTVAWEVGQANCRVTV